MDDWKAIVDRHLQTAQKPLIVILGPTASGKTGFSIEVAKYIGASFVAPPCHGDARMSEANEPRTIGGAPQDDTCEIVNADSRQLYKFLDIGTAKVTEEEMQGVPHHLIDVLDPKEETTAGQYQMQAREVIDDVLEHGKIPLLVGGSMLYISSITDGLTMAPVPDDGLRKRLMDAYDRDHGASLHARLEEVDPETAERIHRNNKPRLVRAVEIYELTRKPKSEVAPRTELRSSDSDCPYDLIIFGMDIPRVELHGRINRRTKQMFDAGWIEEVRGLLEKGYTADDPGIKSCGYREIIRYLQDGEPESPEELQELIAAKTRQYAKRQCTWWRPDKRIYWI